MRLKLIAGNWKMNLNRTEAVALAAGIVKKAGQARDVQLLICPPSVYLAAVEEVVRNSPVALGAQNMFHEPNGAYAYTGEISAAMLLDVGATFVVLGHSERRHILGESDEDVNRKTRAALAAGLTPIVCCGELLAEVIRRQFDRSLAGISPLEASRLVIAYEPVWAIGTGRVATGQQAEEVHADLRRLLADRYNDSTAAQVRILYGGSVKSDNAVDLLAQPNVDGALVGGASLKTDEFMRIAGATGK
jgi:triosephosphate isomerase